MSHDPRYTLFAARAVFDERLTAMDVRVLAALGTFTDRQGWCHPSQTTIAARIGTSRPWVNASIKRLVEAGYVQTVKQQRESGAQAVSLYRILIDLPAPEAVDAALGQSGEILVFKPVSGPDTTLSAGQTPRPLVPATPEKPQDIAPPVSPTDTPLSAPEDTPLSSTADTEGTHKEQYKNKRATRLPATWTPRIEEVGFGRQGGLSEDEVQAAAEHMRDWAASSPKAVKLDWDRTFRNWLRTTISDAKRGRRPVVSAVSAHELERRRKLFEFNGTWNDAEWGPRPTKGATA